MNNTTLLKASALVALSGILYGFLGYLGTGVLKEHFSISTMLFWRFLIAGLWMLLFALKKHHQGKLILNKTILISTFLLGAVGYAGSSGFYFVASQYTGTGLAMVIFFSYPIMIATSAWIKQRDNINKITVLVLMTMSIGLFLMRDAAHHPIHLLGIFFGILAALSYALYLIGSKTFSSAALDSNVLTVTVSLGAAFIFLLFSLTTHTFSVPHTAKSWGYLFAFGILATAIPIQLMLEGLKHISSMRASIISVLEPLVTLIVGMLLLHESVSHLQLLGAIIILLSALLVQFQKTL